MIEEYNRFIYEELLVIYGIPPKYNEESIKRIFDNHSTNRKEWDELLYRVAPELQNKPLDYIPYEIHNFATKLIKKYYDMGNP